MLGLKYNFAVFVFFREFQEYRSETMMRNYVRNHPYEPAKGLKNKSGDFVRETPRFAALLKSLEKAVK